MPAFSRAKSGDDIADIECPKCNILRLRVLGHDNEGKIAECQNCFRKFKAVKGKEGIVLILIKE
jgi:hypothetical protein